MEAARIAPRDTRRPISFWRWILALAWMAVILAFTLTPPGDLGSGLRLLASLVTFLGLAPVTAEYAFHFSAYLVLAILMAGALTHTYLARLSPGRLAVLLSLVAVLGGLQEGLQALAPGRHPALDDLVANVAGGALGAAFIQLRPR